MIPTAGKNYAKKLCEIFGIDPKGATSIQLVCDVNEVVKLQVTLIPDKIQLEKLVEELPKMNEEMSLPKIEYLTKEASAKGSINGFSSNYHFEVGDILLGPKGGKPIATVIAKEYFEKEEQRTQVLMEQHNKNIYGVCSCKQVLSYPSRKFHWSRSIPEAHFSLKPLCDPCFESSKIDGSIPKADLVELPADVSNGPMALGYIMAWSKERRFLDLFIGDEKPVGQENYIGKKVTLKDSDVVYEVEHYKILPKINNPKEYLFLTTKDPRGSSGWYFAKDCFHYTDPTPDKADSYIGSKVTLLSGNDGIVFTVVDQELHSNTLILKLVDRHTDTPYGWFNANVCVSYQDFPAEKVGYTKSEVDVLLEDKSEGDAMMEFFKGGSK